MKIVIKNKSFISYLCSPVRYGRSGEYELAHEGRHDEGHGHKKEIPQLEPAELPQLVRQDIIQVYVLLWRSCGSILHHPIVIFPI